MTEPLRIAIDSRVEESRAGGVSQFLIGLATGLATLESETEEYYFLVDRDSDEWLAPYLGANSRFLITSTSTKALRLRRLAIKVATSRFGKGIRLGYHYLSPLAGRWAASVPDSDGTIESAGIDVMHFAQQWGFATRVPSIYHPHDLQHIHLPQYFTPRQKLGRELTYRALCNQARTVAVAASWGRRDLVEQYGLDSGKVAVVPLAPVLDSYKTPDEDMVRQVRESLGVPEQFLLYPAQTWPHKNHIALLEALALLRSRDDLTVPFVGTGVQNETFSAVAQRIEDLQLADQVHFVDFIPGESLRCLYSMCRLVCIPTLFEAASFPMWEAFLAGAPVACSNVTSLPEQAGEAALIFDPRDVVAIAGAIKRLWLDAELRNELSRRGRERVAQFTWEATAKLFRAHYRRLGGRAATVEDEKLLSAAPLL